MYIGKHSKSYTDDEPSNGRVLNIPENYSGNAFAEPVISEENETPQAPREENKQDAEKASAKPIFPNFSALGKLSPRIEKLFSSDSLLILLALLLWGSEDGGDLSVLLLLLLLF